MAQHTCMKDMLGNTPLVRLSELERACGLRARLYAKLEGANPAGSAKDRVAYHILSDFAARGLLSEDTVVVEATSGNTGIALAALGRAFGVKVAIVMPDNMSEERRRLICAYGAELVLTPAALGMAGANERAEELAAQNDRALLAGQFVNPMGVYAHYVGTGPEIYRDLQGQIGAFVCGVGTGGTVTGVGRYLKEQDARVRVFGVEPRESAVLSGGVAAPHELQGIGAGFVPEILDRSLLDGVLTASKADAYGACRLLAREQSILAGISGGAALSCALELCRREELSGQNVVVLLADFGERYLSTDLYGEGAV